MMTRVGPKASSTGIPGGIAFNRLPPLSMRWLLGALVIATAAPLIVLTTIMIAQLVRGERQATREQLMGSARTLAALIDNEIDSHIALASGLAVSSALDSSDLVAFRLRAKQALEFLPGAWIDVSDPTGHVLASTLVEPGEPLPPRGDLAVMKKAWATGTPQVSDLIFGPIAKRQHAFIEYPVFRDGKRLVSLVVGLDSSRFLKLIGDKFGGEAAVGILDRDFKFVARIPDSERRIGTLASEGWRASIAQSRQGFSESNTLEGNYSLTAYLPTRDGWIAGVSFPFAVLDAPARHILWSLGLLGAFLTFVSLALGYGVASQLNRMMISLAAAAGRVGRGDIIPIESVPVVEGVALSRALSDSSRELARRETALIAAQTTLQRLVEYSPFGVYVVDADFRLTLIGAGAQKVFANVHPLIGRDFAEILRIVWDEPFASEAIGIFRHTLTTGEPYHSSDTVGRRRDTKDIEAYDWKVERLSLADGRFGVVCHFYDLSERQQFEAALRESEARFRGTFENAAVGVAHVGLDGKWIRVNQRFCELVGYSQEELTSLTFQDITYPDDRAADLENRRWLLAGEAQTYSLEKRYVRKDASILWIGITVSLQSDAAGAPEYFISVVQEIAARKEAQDHLAFLLRELAHRSKNQLSVIQAIASQTARRSDSLEGFLGDFAQRIRGLAVATDLLVAQDWNGASIGDLVDRQSEAFAPDPSRLVRGGPQLWLSPDATQAIGLALHELATNSVKYGAWSTSAGIVNVAWSLGQKGELCLSWIESGGAVVAPPSRKGFGHLVIERMVAQKLNGRVELAFKTEGLTWTLWAPAPAFMAQRG